MNNNRRDTYSYDKETTKYPTITYQEDNSPFGRPPALPVRSVLPAIAVQPAPKPNVVTQPQSRPTVASYGQLPFSVGQQYSNAPVPPPRVDAQPRPRMQYSQPPIAEFAPHANNTKKAIIIGCNYTHSQFQLKGCIHDARNVKHMLCTVFGFPEHNVRLLLDDGSSSMLPTKENIINSMHWLISGSNCGDSLFFHFSGHGSQERDPIGDERDGLNETLLPCDFEQQGHLVDDDINRILVNPLPRGVYLHAIIDACHSGTAMDLEHYTKIKNSKFEWRSEGPCRLYKGTSGGIAILFSACSDGEVAQDTDNLTGGVHTGAATHAFIEAVVNNGQHQSYAQVLYHMCKTLEKLTGHPAHKSGIAGKILGTIKSEMLSALGIPKQTPQLSCNVKFNLYEPLHI